MVVLFQILVRILQQQNEDGSWGSRGSREETAYAIISLSNVVSLPFLNPIEGQIETAISRGRKYLRSIKALENIKLTPNDYIWVGKISYGVEIVCHSYVIAASNGPVPRYILGPRVSALVRIPVQKVDNFGNFYAKLPMFARVEPWILKAWVIEGYLFLPDLAKRRLEVFSRRGMDEEKYLEYIPFSWIAASGLENTQASAQMLFDMMMISMVNFQVDEFFDGVISKGDPLTIARLRKTVEKLFSGLTISRTSDIVNGFDALNEHELNIYRQLECFLHFAVTNPRIQNAGDHDKAQLLLELKFYLFAHTQQIEDNFKFQRQSRQKTYYSPPSSYARWVRTTASDHLSSQYAFAFWMCLLTNDQDYLPNSEIKYIAQDCCTRLSVICRMFNDYGSLARDRKESNVNSMCFPDFDGEQKEEKDLLAELVKLTKYERKFLDLSFDELKKVCGSRHRRIYEMTKLFYNASELYTEVYEVRDVSVSH
jgi:hypothetical protein